MERCHRRAGSSGSSDAPGRGSPRWPTGSQPRHPIGSWCRWTDSTSRQRELIRIGRADRKGAPDTFDVDGYVALLRRIRDEADTTVYAPRFDRHIEEPIANAIAVEPHHTTVVTEGNYLLHDRDGWEHVRPLLDECWYVECDDTTRTARLIARHVEHGRSDTDAAAWAQAVDEPNARLIRQSRDRADAAIRSDDGHATFPIEPDRHCP